MSHPGGARLHKIVCTVLAILILAPFCLAFGDSGSHYCSCGMKKGDCACDLSMHRMSMKMGSHCGMGVGGRCAMRAPRPTESDTPRVVLDLRHRLGIFDDAVFGFGLDPRGTLETAEVSIPLSLAFSPESPPPRTSPFPFS